MTCLQELAKKVPRDFELVSQKKGFKRFMSPQLRGLLKQRADALEAKEAAMANILQVQHYPIMAQSGLCSIQEGREE